MKFIDEAYIFIKAGDGGNGCVSFSKNRTCAYSAPDGGDGGNGGNIYIRSLFHLNTLSSFHVKKKYIALNGLSGSYNNCKGKSGIHLFIDVPVGTKIYDDDNNILIIELLNDGQFYLIAKGGKGGVGNFKLKSSFNRSPQKAISGDIGIKKNLFLRLILLADIGLLGLPNAGKSSFLNCFTNAKSKVSNYFFTTLYPKLGVINSSNKKIIIADIPGIIYGASYGNGLGLKFLGHLYRTKLLLHIVDVSYMNINSPEKSIQIIQKEIYKYSNTFYNKECWLIFNKVDLLDNDINIIKYCKNIVKKTKFIGKYFIFSSKTLYNKDKILSNILSYIF